MQDKVSTIKSHDLSVSLIESAKTLYVTIAGSISRENSELLKQAFDKIATMKSEKVILNLYDTPKISPSGIAKLLLLATKLSSQARKLVIEDVHNDLIAIFKSINLHKFINAKDGSYEQPSA